MTLAYLDYNATAPVRPAVIDAVAAALAVAGNPSSVHRAGRAARRVVEEARERVAAAVGAAPGAVVFTSGGTEANALALAGSGRRRLLVSAVEHDSLRAVPGVELIPVDHAGRVDPTTIERLLAADSRPALVSVMLANNETGVIQPVAAIARAAKVRGALVHCDATQAVGRIPVSMAALGVDLLTLSAHKLGGPQGVGALIVDEMQDLTPLLLGGGQERRRRAGTENVAGIAGFAVAAAEAVAGLADMGRIAGLRDALERRAAALDPRVRVLGATAERLPNTTCLACPGVASEIQVIGLDLAGVMVSAGAACSSGKIAASHVLGAMGVAAAEAAAAIRVSLGWASAPADVDRFIEAWGALLTRAGNYDEDRKAASAA